MGFEPTLIASKCNCSAIEPYRFLTVDVLLREVRLAFDLANASHLRMLSLAGYLQSLVIPEHACPFHTFMGTALVCCSDFLPLPAEHDARISLFYLPVSPCAFRLPKLGDLPHIAASPIFG